MTQSTETVSQRDYEAAQVLFDDILGDAASYAEFNRPSYREAAVRTLTESFADKDETIAKLRDGFIIADEIACAAIKDGFYVGEGLLAKLADARAALTRSNDDE